jgi:hypothetical protein
VNKKEKPPFPFFHITHGFLSKQFPSQKTYGQRFKITGTSFNIAQATQCKFE